MIKELVKLSNHLDSKGLAKEADRLDKIITKIAFEGDRPAFSEEAGFVSAGELGYNDATAGNEKKSGDQLRELGYTHKDDLESYEDAYDEFGGGSLESGETKDWAEQLRALMLASMGPGPYKLTEQRLREIGPDNLTTEEEEIVSSA